jgi:hypothetical protein
MLNRKNSDSRARTIAARLISTAGILSALAALSLAGCSSSSATPPSAAMQHVELNFSLDQCQPLDTNLYKCPAIDKPICNPDYNGQVMCVRIGKKKSVFVEQAIMP